MRRVYLSGPVSGEDYGEALAAFCSMEELLKSQMGRETETVNPMLFTMKGAEWQYSMRECMKRLSDCDAICMLRGWRRSRGARVELAMAVGLGLKVYEESATGPSAVNFHPSIAFADELNMRFGQCNAVRAEGGCV